MRTTSSFALVVVGSIGLALTARAEPDPLQTEDWHFKTDTSRHARVDDRGGLGEGFSFSIEYDPSDGNSEDFCPHCRFNIMTSDPGIDLADLEKVGLQRKDLDTPAKVLSALQTVVSKDPTGLAKELAPELGDADLAFYAQELAGVLSKLADVVAGLETYATLATTSFDWDSLKDADALYALVDSLSLKQDSGFDGDFSNPNDPRRHNSGVKVYSLADLISGMANKGVPAGAQQALKDAVSSIPGLSGPAEISGDDDDPTAPASYHGTHTDLTVRQRTYVVNGVSAYLMVFTLTNQTTRVMPLVETSFIADFDIPPGGPDDESDFDGALQMVMTHDPVAYADPEQHYWFGIASAGIQGVPAPGAFTFSGYNLDKNYTIAQGVQSSRDNRFRFFLGDPSIVGDHDDAEGKSEKLGALKFVLNGPLFPGAERTIAFCMAAGEGGSSGAARAELQTVMTACKALYTAFNPTCGDGIPGYGEDCDSGGVPTATCTATCQSIKCGDGRVLGDEECDDGNIDPGDGCSAACKLEYCGNGVVEGDEECDDGNPSNTDDCLTTCKLPTCGDGAVRACTGDGCGPCGDHQYCWQGSFRITDLSSAVNTFATFFDETIDYVIAFDAAATTTAQSAGGKQAGVTSGPVHVELHGNPAAAAALAAALEGKTFDLVARTNGQQFVTTQLNGRVGDNQIGFSVTSQVAGFDVDRDGFPILATVSLRNAVAHLAVTTDVIGPPADSASGPLSGDIGALPPGAAGEKCDDGNLSDFDTCTSKCVPAACGDGIVQVDAGEECDPGAIIVSWCTAACKLVSAEACGNGNLEAAIGETCDDSNRLDGDGCSHLCQIEACGDGVVQVGAGEECDDGANGDGDGCTDLCKREVCGDGVVQPNEACDDGPANSDSGKCTSKCEIAKCGDGLVQVGAASGPDGEECDDGNDVAGDGCSACKVDKCGDGHPGPGEECDDGNSDSGDGCTPACVREYCGDHQPGPGEQCDDGNALGGDGCDKDCQLENPGACGDGKVGVGEQCDDGGTATGDGCDAFCQLENPAACGDGTLDPGESCDDGNAVDGDGCTAKCLVERCGDGFQQAGEGCDDGNDDSGDGCSSKCAIEPADCGNGKQEYGEQCDDGNDAPGDGCDANCKVESKAPLGETCGNGVLDIGEECDDGGRMDGNGCDELCQLEASVCGNSRIERGETCDDGNDVADDGCDACHSTITPPKKKDSGCAGGAADPGILASLAILAALVAMRGARLTARRWAARRAP